MGAQRSSKKLSHSRRRHDDRVPQERLEKPIQLLLVHVELEEPARVRNRIVARLQPNALCGFALLPPTRRSLADMPALLRPHSSGNDRIALDALDQLRRRNGPRARRIPEKSSDAC